MSTLEVPAGHGNFSNESVGLKTKLVDAIAKRDGLPIYGDMRPDYFRAKAEAAASDAIKQWERNPRAPANEVELVLVAMSEHVARWRRQRQAMADQRAAMDAQRREAAIAREPAKEYALRFLDQNSGRTVEIVLQADQVRFLDEAAS